MEWCTQDHGAVLIGYGSETVAIADPISGMMEYDREQFESVFESRDRQCVIISEIQDVLIQGGTFDMGSTESEPWRGQDETQHSVTVGDFYMDSFELTQEQYQSVVGSNPSNFTGEKLPVENVSWLDAINYCNARSQQEGLTPAYTVSGDTVSWNRTANNYRLPTEVEWEYACRTGTTTPFNTETSISADESNFWGNYPYLIEDNYFSQGNLETQRDQNAQGRRRPAL